MSKLARALGWRLWIVMWTLCIADCSGSVRGLPKDSSAGRGGTKSVGGSGGTPDVSTSMEQAGSAGDVDPGTSPVVTAIAGSVVTPSAQETGLPDLPRLFNVKASVVGDSTSLSFDPVSGAVDYRVYALPSKADVKVSDGRVAIQGAVYRCSGSRQAPPVPTDAEAQTPGGALRTLIDGQDVDGTKRSLADATLGYVYAEPGSGRTPVYALGEPSARSDNSCFFQRFTASRVKQYVASESDRQKLLKQGFRDDGIAFYVPDSPAGKTAQVVTATTDTARYYFVSGRESRSNPTPAFEVLTDKTEGTVPLMRAFYQNGCGQSHDELVAGEARFAQIRRQGDRVPLNKLHWSGLTKQTTLVIEALDAGCPFQGVVAPASKPESGKYLAWKTPQELQASAPNRELYINGQFDGTQPKPIARSYVSVMPGPVPELDWAYGFSANDDFGQFSPTACGADNCFMMFRQKASPVDVTFLSVEEDRYAHGKLFGEWWVAYTDWASDTNGKYRLTPTKKGEISADSYLYVSMEVDSFTTARRYPQLLISDQDAPVQIHLKQGKSLIVQTFQDWPNRYELQVCDHRNWDVNDQCPRFDLYQQHADGKLDKTTGLAPGVEVGEQVGMDFSNRFEVYVSAKRAYMFLDGQPYGCADLPQEATPTGPVTVTFGDVLYHSGVDKLFTFTEKYRQTVAVRHYDNLGFKSHMPAPAWDSTRFPCASLMQPD